MCTQLHPSAYALLTILHLKILKQDLIGHKSRDKQQMHFLHLGQSFQYLGHMLAVIHLAKFLQKRDNLSTKDKRLALNCVHYSEVPLYLSFRKQKQNLSESHCIVCMYMLIF